MVKTEITYSRLFEKQVKKVPSHIRDKVWEWVFTVRQNGIDDAMKVRAYRDEALKGKRSGQRSIRLSKAYRLIYEKHKSGVKIHILEVNKHEY